MPLTPELRKQRATIAAYARWSKHDAAAGTQKPRAAFLQRFVDQVDPDRVLTAAERDRRAKAALKAHMAQLAFKSAKARAKRAG